MIPQIVQVSSYSIHTLWFFVLFGLMLVLFTIWNESRKDGFDQVPTFDIFISVMFISLLLYKILSLAIETFNFYSNFLTLRDVNVEAYKILFAFIVFVGVLVAVGRMLRWSVYRILDIYSLASLLILAILSLGKFILVLPSFNVYYLLIFAVFIAIYVILKNVRNKNLNSGWVFSLILLLYTFTGVLFYRELSYLIFYVFLIIMSSVNLYLREQDQMLNTNFLAILKKKLLSKNKRIKAEQKLLLEEDPYLNDTDRTKGNAEEIDEAILEDETKNLIDTKRSTMDLMRIQIRKALAKIKLGRYGICDVCGKRIDPARLKAYPEATACLDCASKASN